MLIFIICLQKFVNIELFIYCIGVYSGHGGNKLFIVNPSL